MDRLLRAFNMLGGVEWDSAWARFRHVPVGEAWGRERWKKSSDEWVLSGFRTDHEAESELLRAMLDKAEKKWPEIRLSSSNNARASLEYQWIIWENDTSDTALGHGPTVFDALLDALENANA